MPLRVDIGPEFIESFQRLNRMIEPGQQGTHGPLTLTTFVNILLEDVALAYEGNDRWSGEAMASLLRMHGYLPDRTEEESK